jgi:hypothetical protein
MTVRHSTALALVVWYLIMPPSLTWKSKQTQLANIFAQNWEIIQKYDSEKSCRIAAGLLDNQVSLDWRRKNQTVQSMQWLNRRLAAECVDNFDPRVNPLPPNLDGALFAVHSPNPIPVHLAKSRRNPAEASRDYN